MTDNEIKKALECCSEKVDYEGNEDTCCSCSLITDDCCTCTLAKLALDLINRLQAENERLQANSWYVDNIQGLYAKIKAEAYKEFAEKSVERVEKAKSKYQRLCKEQGEEMQEHMHIHFNGIIGIINNLLKEKVGDK